MKPCLKHFLLCFGALFFAASTIAQQKPKSAVSSMVDTLTAFGKTNPPEKLYLQTDKPNYVSNDTLWFKAYLLDAAYLAYSSKSGIMYVEVANDSNRVIKRLMLPVVGGLAAGQLALDAKEYPHGSYILRAYTNWMRNFGEPYIFKKQFYISNPTDAEWLINYRANIKPLAGKSNVQMNMRFTQIDQNFIGLHNLKLQLMNGKSSLLKSDVTTSIEGALDVNFDLPAQTNASKLAMVVQDAKKGSEKKRYVLPLVLNRPEYIDLQFMPEGGNLVAGLPAQVAFKAINEDGKGVNISGEILDGQQTKVAGFSASHKGIGVFSFRPQAAQSYTARVKLPNGEYKSYALPAVAPSGTVISVSNPYGKDTCEIAIHGTPDLVAAANSYYLVGMANGVVCFAASLQLKDGGIKHKLSKKIFPGGVARFTLLSVNKTPLNERLIYVNADNLFTINIDNDKQVYAQRDSAVLTMHVTDKAGVPVRGTFSIAVTDDAQVKADNDNHNLITQMLLANDVKGSIEDPSYYQNAAANETTWQDMDRLLLAQGWVAYNWQDPFKRLYAVKYPAEAEFAVTGRVTNVFNKPVASSGVTLMSKKPFLLADTVTDTKGVFRFTDILPADTAIFFIQAKNKKGKSFNVGIEVDEFVPPVFTGGQRLMMPWYVNIDTGRLKFVNRQAKLIQERDKNAAGIALKEVVITGKKIIKDSKNLNGPGGADIILDQRDLEKKGRKTLRNLLEEYVPGFGLRFKKWSHESYYAVRTMHAHLIIDGVDIEFAMFDGQDRGQYMSSFLDYYNAEDIKGIEVMYLGGNNMRYTTQFLGPFASPFENAFIEVTTRGGAGPFLKKTPGTYLFKPMAFTLPKTFYSPKYSVDSKADMSDLRSTVYWNPNVITDKDGCATISFYTADNPGNYSVVVEGADLQGGLGVKTSRMVVKKQ